MTTSLIVSLAAAGCGDDSCGPGDAKDDALALSSADVTINFGGITAGANNDCPVPGTPDGVVSLTLHGLQVDGPGRVTLCISRPDLMQKEGVALGGTSVQIVDLNGDVDGCMYDYESMRPVTGTVTAQGVCDNGTNSAGFALIVSGAVSLNRVCPTATDIIAVSFAGTVAVAADQP